MGAYRTIQLKGKPRYEEARASVILKPGHLIQTTIGTTDQVKPHATAGGAAVRKFAFEDALQGKTTDNAYAIGDLVPYGDCFPGNEVAARLAPGEVVEIGTELESAGDGTLQVATTGEIVAESREVLDLSDTGAVETLFAVLVR